MFLTRVAATAAAFAQAAAGGVLTAGSASAATWQYHNLDGDRFYDIATLDTDGNGYFNDMWMDLDNDDRWDTRQWNSYGSDSFHESMSFNMDEDSYVESELRDTDQRTGFDFVCYNQNDDGYWDTGWLSFSTGYSVTKDMAQAAVNLGPGQWVYNPYA